MMTAAHDIFADSTAHILAELGYLDLLLRRAVLVARSKRPANESEALRGLVISEVEVDNLTETVDRDDAAGRAESLISDLDASIEQRREENRLRMERSRGKGVHLSLARVAQLCGFSEAEKDLLLVALAPEFDTRYETIYAYLQNDVTRKRPSAELALNLICRSPEEKIAARRFLTPGAPLLHFRIIALGEEAYDRQPVLLRRFLKLDDTVLRYLLDQPPAAAPGVRPVMPSATVSELSVSTETGRALEALVAAIERTGTQNSVIQLVGRPEAPLEAAAIAIGCALQRPLLIVDPGRLTEDVEAAATIARDAALWNALPLLARAQPTETEAERARLRTAEGRFWECLRELSLGAIILGRPEDLRQLPADARPWRLKVEPPDYALRRELWRAAVRGSTTDLDAKRLADLFPFDAARVRQAVTLAHTQASLRNPSDPVPSEADLMQAARMLATPSLQRYAVAVTPRFGWDDIVLPADRKQQLRSVAARVTNRAIVQREWGLGGKPSRGRGVAVLLSGPPGTGKTMAAEVLANALALDLFQIDLSTVVSKYIGEAEKQLATIFAEAEQGQCILFFDECDAIFAKRTEVQDAHDRYANTEVSYLLQRLEQYEGIVLLATNFQKNIDEAFLRRLHDSVDFPFPDEAAREQIWRRQFSEPAPIDPKLDYGFLAAQFKLTGGYIRNAAIYAAYRAAEEDGRKATIRLEHILEGVRREFQKQGKLVSATELGMPLSAPKRARTATQ
jgi:SpoVK/Ycf46/Vps4 family AAA+-type ATPase